MNKFVIAIIMALAVICHTPTSAFNIKLKKDPKPQLDYTTWVESKELPSTEDGITMFYPQSLAGDSATVIRGTLPVKELSAEQVMLAAMVFASENFNTEKDEHFDGVNFNDRQFSIVQSTTTGSYNKEATYSRKVTFFAKPTSLEFEVKDIRIKYRQKGLIPRTMEIETMHPESDTRHEELVLELSHLISEYLDRMVTYAAKRIDIKASHYAEILEGKVVVGMSPDEVILVKGPAREIRKSGERIRWIYDNEDVIIFTKGVVSKIID